MSKLNKLIVNQLVSQIETDVSEPHMKGNLIRSRSYNDESISYSAEYAKNHYFKKSKNPTNPYVKEEWIKKASETQSFKRDAEQIILRYLND